MGSPAIRVVETCILKPNYRKTLKTKWAKNLIRTTIVGMTVIVALLFEKVLD